MSTATASSATSSHYYFIITVSSNTLSYLWILLQLALSIELSSTAEAPRSFRWLNCPWGRKAPCPPPDPKLNYRPVIGILSHPCDGASGRLNNATNASYIAASYVKFVESGGARVVPLIYNEPSQILHKKLNLVNGVLLPGGSTKKVIYIDVVESIFKNVVRRNDAGDHFPLLAICLGSELLAIIVGKDKGILEVFNAKDEASNLQFMKNTSLAGTVFERFPPSLLKKLATECLTMGNHHVYVSTVQARKYPMIAFQWHPEKNAFEWGLPGIPHSEAAVQVTQNVANYFVREARKSVKRPSPGETLEYLIYKHKPTYSGRAGRGFDQVYIFS